MRAGRLLSYGAVAFGLVDLAIFLYPLGYVAVWPAVAGMIIVGLPGALTLAGLITLCLQRLRPGGRLVMNFVTLENLATATAALTQAGATWGTTWDVLQLQAARSKPILAMHRMAAENPVWIVCAEKAVADV